MLGTCLNLYVLTILCISLLCEQRLSLHLLVYRWPKSFPSKHQIFMDTARFEVGDASLTLLIYACPLYLVFSIVQRWLLTPQVRTRGANVMRQAPSIEGAVTYAFIAPQSVTQRDKEVDTISKSDSETTATSESPSDVQAKRKAPQQSKEVQHEQVPAKKTKKQRKKAQQALPVFRAGAKASLDGTRNEESSTDAGADDNVDFFAEWVKATGGDPSKLRKTEVRAKDADEDQSSDDSSSIDDDSDDDDLLAELILARRNRRL